MHAILRTSGCTAAALLLTLGLGLPAQAHERYQSPRTYSLSGVKLPFLLKVQF